MRKLASIQVVEEITPIEGADYIEVARVLGWRCVVKKGILKPGDHCVFFEVDSAVPKDVPALSFMESKDWRVKTIRLRGQISQGLALSVSDFPWLAGKSVGDDVSRMIGGGVFKWEPKVKPALRGESKGSFPIFIRKTDEPRIQSNPDILERHRDKVWYYSEKLDGTSFTAYSYQGEFGVCSRNINLKPGDTVYWEVARDTGLVDSLPTLCQGLGYDIAVQGEIIGPGIQGNKYKRDRYELYVFSVFNISTGRYVGLEAMKHIVYALELQTVPIVRNISLAVATVDSLVADADGRSALADTPREGLVWRTVKDTNDRRQFHVSFKVISNKFLLKHP